MSHFSSARLWSLWDMQSREAKSFVDALAALERVHVLVEYGLGKEKPNDEIDEAVKKRGLRHLEDLKEAISGLGVKATAAAIKRTRDQMQDGITFKELGRTHRDIFSRFKDEMEGRKLLFLDVREAGYFENETPLGEDIANAFPPAAFDLEEAAKCFAVGRYTACVFHLMRAAEAASVMLAGALDATTHDEHSEQLSLGVITANIDAKIAKMPKGAKRDDWLKVPYLMHSCNRAYRTKTAHPADVYTEEQADRAIHATCALLQEFAELVASAAV